MARSRNFKPEHLLDERLAACSMPARLLFHGLGTVADRAGRLEDRPLRIKAAVLPYDSVDVEPLLAELAHHGMITRYQAGEARYIQLTDWDKHQTPHHKEPDSVLPAPPQPGQPVDAMGQKSGHAEASPGKNGASTCPAALIPDSGFLIADSGSLIPEGSSAGQPSAGTAAAPRKAKKATNEGKTVPTWAAYAESFRRRYGSDPLRNAAVNGQLARLVDTVGAEDAPKVAAFYLASSERFYVERCHPVELLLRDAQKLRTLWATGGGQASRHTGFRDRNYSEGVGPNGELLT